MWETNNSDEAEQESERQSQSSKERRSQNAGSHERSSPEKRDPLGGVGAFPESIDVVIVGAGPSGLTLACDLARRGINFLIFDINARPVTQSRALMLQSRSLEILADLGVSEAAILKGHIVRGSTLFINNKSVLDLKFTGVQGPFPFALILEQSQTEKLLIERLAELGHQVHRPVAIWKVEVPEAKETAVEISEGSGTSPDMSVMLAAHNAVATAGPVFQSGLITPETNGFNGRSPTGTNTFLPSLPSFVTDSYCTIHVKPLDSYGRPMDSPVGQIRCRYVIGCDGAKSSVRKAVDIPFDDRSELAEYLVADVSVRWGLDLKMDRLQFLQSPSGVLVCIPMPDEKWRIICTRKCVPEAGEMIEPFQRFQAPEFAELQQIVSALVPGTLLEETIWSCAFSLNSRIVRRFRQSSAILVGDAAHVHPPTFGQGMNTGIQDAYNLGWKLAAVVRGAPARLLDTYSHERKQIAEGVARTSQRVLESFIKPGLAFRCLFSALGPVLGHMEFISNYFSQIICQTDTLYTSSPIVSNNYLGRAAVEPGMRIPNAPVVSLPMIWDEVANRFETPKALVNYARGGHHTLLLSVHVLPPGTKARTIFGCERSEEAVRWNSKCLEKLARLARLLSESLKGREREIVHGGVKIVWVLCGLVNFKSPSNSVGLGQIRDHVPHRLMYFFVHGSKVGGYGTAVAVDYEDSVHMTLGLRLADPDGTNGADKSGAFVLVRPDGHIVCNGYAGDTQATGFALDYVLNWLSD